MKAISTTIAGAVIAAAAVGLTAGLAPASAAPPPQSGANLYISPDDANPANYRVTIAGVFPMSAYDAHGYINNINNGQTEGYMAYDLQGDDGNTHAITPGFKYPGAGQDATGFLRAEADGIHFYRVLSLAKDVLNEDRDGVDEVFARAIFVDSDWGTRTAYSNLVTGNF